MRKEFYPWGFVTVLLFQINAAVWFLCCLNCFSYFSTSVGATWVWAVVAGALSTVSLLLVTLDGLFKFKRNYDLLYVCLLLSSVVCAYVTYGLANFELPHWYIYPISFLCYVSAVNVLFVVVILTANLFANAGQPTQSKRSLIA